MLVDIDDLTHEERKEYGNYFGLSRCRTVVKRLKGNYGPNKHLSASMGVSLQSLLMDTAALAAQSLLPEKSFWHSGALVVDIDETDT